MFDGMKREVRQYRNILGKNVTARPTGEENGIRRGVITTPLEGQDALCPTFLLGFDSSLTGPLHGQVTAVLHHDKENNDTFVAVPRGEIMLEPQIRFALALENDPARHIYCLNEKSCGAVLYTRHNGTLYYLLIKNQSGHIGFPKGHVELGEEEGDTVCREIMEETGLIVKPDFTFREEYDYILCGVIHKKAVYYMAEFSYESKIIPGENEIFGQWLLPYEDAKKKLGFPNDRKILTKVHQRLNGTIV